MCRKSLTGGYADVSSIKGKLLLKIEKSCFEEIMPKPKLMTYVQQ